MQSEYRPLEPGTHIRYIFDRREFIGTVIQAGFYSIWVKVDNSITEHFIHYEDVLEVLRSTK